MGKSNYTDYIRIKSNTDGKRPSDIMGFHSLETLLLYYKYKIHTSQLWLAPFNDKYQIVVSGKILQDFIMHFKINDLEILQRQCVIQ